MASIDLEDDALMEQDYFGDDNDEELEMPPMVAPLSPLTSYNESAGNQPSTEPGILDGLLGEPEPGAAGETATRRLVNRKPQPKLDEQLLTGPRGLPSLKKHFERVKFKGKGNEVEDLGLLMSEMEHWLNRLYPKLTMREMITKLEKLGRKQKVKTCISKIRMDMPILPEDFVGGEEDLDDDVLRGDMDEGEEGGHTGDGAQSGTAASPSQSTNKPTLTEDQRKRIEEKKRQALERKAAREAKLTQGGPEGSSQEEQGGPGGISQEELDSMQVESDLARTEAQMMEEIDGTAGGNRKEQVISSQVGAGELHKDTGAADSGLTEADMEEIERELMG